MQRLFSASIVLAIVVGFARAFSFTLDPPLPKECSETTFRWEGGQPPFNLLILSPGWPLRNISLPSEAFKNNKGEFKTVMNFPKLTGLLFAMSDATGVTAGGITPQLFVDFPDGDGEPSCDLSVIRPDFYFSLNGNLTECQPYPFTYYSGAIQPITIYGFIPAGPSFTLNPPVGDTYDYIDKVPAGTSVTFIMMDSQGRAGGSSQLKAVAPSENKACLDPTLVSAKVDVPRPSNTKGPNTKSKSDNTAAIVGGAVGGVLGIALLAGIFFWLRRRKQNTHPESATFAPNTSLLPGGSPTSQVHPNFFQGNGVTPFFVPPAPMTPSSHVVSASGKTEGSCMTDPSTSTYPVILTPPAGAQVYSEAQLASYRMSGVIPANYSTRASVAQSLGSDDMGRNSLYVPHQHSDISSPSHSIFTTTTAPSSTSTPVPAVFPAGTILVSPSHLPDDLPPSYTPHVRAGQQLDSSASAATSNPPSSSPIRSKERT